MTAKKKEERNKLPKFLHKKEFKNCLQMRMEKGNPFRVSVQRAPHALPLEMNGLPIRDP